MGIFTNYMNQTRKPEGFAGKIMVLCMNSGHAALAKWGTSYLQVSAPERIADLGCGGGGNIRRLAEKYEGARVTGVDYSSVSVQKSAEYNEALINAGRAEVVQGDVSALSLGDGEYDLVTAYETIYFWPDLEKCFAEVARIMKPDGTFMIVNESDGCDEISRKFEKIIDGMKLYTAEQIEAALRSAGFEDVRTYHHVKKPWICVQAKKHKSEPKDSAVSIGAPGTDYANWVPTGMVWGFAGLAAAAAAANIALWKLLDIKNGKIDACVKTVLGAGFAVSAAFAAWMAMANRTFSYKGRRKLSRDIVEHTAEYVNIPDGGVGLDVGCGSGALTIACAKRNPDARMVGCDRWGAEYASFSKRLCENNAAAEGVSNVSFRNGDAAKLPFADGSFDAVTSNYVYHNVVGADKQELLRETLRVLKKGGTFAIHDLMSKARYGDMDKFVDELKAEGYEDVRLIYTGKGLFMPEMEASKMMLSDSTLLVGKK